MKTLTNIVKSITPLYESILAGRKESMQKTREDLHKHKYFGGHFKFLTNQGVFRHVDMSIISIKALTRLTKGMDFKNPETKAEMEKGFMYHSEKLEKFILWIDNIDLSEYGLENIDINNNSELSKLGNVIKKKMFDEGIFNKPQIISWNMYRGDGNGFHLSIHKKSEWAQLFFHFEKVD